LDRLIAALARRQHGVVAHRQLLKLGLGKTAIHGRVTAGRLHRVHRGVYAVGHTVLTSQGHLIAAVLACGDGAVLSHRSAADLWNLRRSSGAAVDVTVQSSGRGRRKGIRVHQVSRLHPKDVTTRARIPITTFARTLLDLAAVLNERQLTYVIEQAERHQRFDQKAIKEACARSPRHRGLIALRAAVQMFEPELLHTRSNLEREFVEQCRRFGLPIPAMNVVVAGHTVDAYWAEQRLVVEIDGAAYHRTPTQRQRDAKRDADLRLAGHKVLRIPGEALENGVATVSAFLAQANAGAPATTRLRPSTLAR
jgi:Protein of unknown function (DUF559)/Transcriptional regulator, AbiEi antitoxin